MKSYATVDQMFYETCKSLRRLSDKIDSRDGSCSEQIGWVGRLRDLSSTVLNVPGRNFSHRYASAELLWYLSGTDRGELISKFAPQYSRFLREDGTAEGAYGPRMFGQEMGVLRAIKELREASKSRRAVVPVFNSRDLLAARHKSKDVPCTISLQFLIRDGTLSMISTMRSNDVWLGMPYDVFCFTQIQRLVAERLFLKAGWYQHQVGSMHLYDRDAEKVDLIAPSHGPSVKTFSLPWYVTTDVAGRGDTDKVYFETMRGLATSALEGTMSNDEKTLLEYCPQAFQRLCRIVLDEETELDAPIGD